MKIFRRERNGMIIGVIAAVAVALFSVAPIFLRWANASGPSPDATISLTSTEGTVSCPTGTNPVDCTLSVTSTISPASLNFTPTLQVAGGSITVDGSSWTSGTKYTTSTPGGSSYLFTINVTGADASTSTYYLTINDTFPNLSGLVGYGTSTISATNGDISITTDGTNAWVGDDQANIYKVTPSGTITTYKYGGTDSGQYFGLVYDGTNFWETGYAASSGISKLTPVASGTWATYNVPATGYTDAKDGFYSLALDKYNNIWAVNWDDSNVVEMSPTGTYIGNFPTAKTDSYLETSDAIAYDGTNMWVYAGDGYVTELSPTGTILTSLYLSSYYPAGIVFDGTNMWAASMGGTVYKISSSGSLLATYQVPINTVGGIAFDGKNIWVASQQSGAPIVAAITPSGTIYAYRMPVSQFYTGALAYASSTNTIWGIAGLNNEGVVAFSANQAMATTYTITVTQGSNGTISPSTVSGITGGSSETFTITPNAGYEIGSLTVDGSSVAATSSYTFSNITADHTITAAFLPVPLSISPTSLSAGTVGTDFSQVLTASTTVSGTFTWSLAGGSLPSGVALNASSTAATTTIAGTPAGSGTFNFTVKVANGSSSGTQAFSWTVNAAAGSGGGGESSPVVYVAAGGTPAPGNSNNRHSSSGTNSPPNSSTVSATTTNATITATTTSTTTTTTSLLPPIPSAPAPTKKQNSYVFVIEDVVNGYGGTATPASFTLSANGTNVSPPSFHGNASGTMVSMKTGKYSISQKSTPGYEGSLSSGCSGMAIARQVAVCLVVTAQLPPPHLTVVENVINSYFGTLAAPDFAVNVKGVNASPASFAGNASGTLVSLAPGRYSVREKPIDDYIISFSSGCSGSVVYGSAPVCTVTASDPPIARLLVVENVLNNYGGTKTPSDFSLSVSGKGVSPSSFKGDASGTLVSLNPGTYAVSQKTVTGYTVATSSGCKGSIVAGEVVLCDVVTAQIPPPQFAVFQDVVNSYGGTSTPADFTISVKGVNASPASFAGNASGTLVSLAPGRYSVREKPATGYLIALSPECSGNATYGSTLTCVVTASQIKPVGYIPPASTSTAPTSTPPIAPTSTPTSTPSSTISTGGGTNGTTTPTSTSVSAPTSTGPIGITIGDGGPVVTSTQVTITLSSLPPGQIETSNEGGQDASGWVNVPAGPYPWNLTPGQGIKTVTVEYRPQGEVLGAAATASGTRSVFLDLGQSILQEPQLDCSGLYLTGYAFVNRPTDPATVIKIQKFLNKYMGTDLVVNGVYGVDTQVAVDQFQVKYSSEVLTPWIPYGLPNSTTPTANTYKTTQRWINILACPSLNLPMPHLP